MKRVLLSLIASALVAAVFLADLNQDEGWYLYAARIFSEGQRPYRDFFFTQGPIFPVVYGALAPLWAPFGLLGGRLLTALFSFLALLLGARTASLAAVGDRGRAALAGIVFLSLTGLNLWYLHFTAIPKAYALCTFFIASALWILAKPRAPGNRYRCWQPLAAGLLLAVLSGVRLSMGILLPVVGLSLLVRRKTLGDTAWLLFSIGGMLGLVAAYGPALLNTPDAFLAAQQYHAARAPFGPLAIPGCIARLVRFNPLAALAVLGSLTLLFIKRKAQATDATLRNRRLTASGSADTGRSRVATATRNHLSFIIHCSLMCAVALAAVHILAPVPYDDYFIPALFPLALALAALSARRLPAHALRPLSFAAPAAALLLTMAASPVAERWFCAGQDRFWMRLYSEPQLFVLHRVGRLLRSEADRLGTDTLWTQDTYLAIAAGLRVPAGMEMGPFSPPCDALAHPERYKLAAWSGYTASMIFPSLTPTPPVERAAFLERLSEAFPRTLLRLSDFGQGATKLTVAARQ